jgi:WD40 repeat protein
MKIFISSPGDVDKERRIAERLMDRLATEFAGRVPIEPYFWEYEPMRHDRNFQDQIPPTTQFDLIICILWSRLGTPLKGPDGREYASGTEYEVLSAREAKATLGKPEVLVYRNLTPAQIRQLPAAERRRLFAQLEALDNFISRYCVDPESGAIKGAFTTYQDLGEFEIKLEKHLRKLIEAQLPATAASTDQKPVATWTSGSPFRGLEAFDFAHAPIFFGRVRAIGDVLALLRQRMAQVEDARALNLEGGSIKPAAFVLVSAMSGVGKSSLVRAGVLPLLVQPGDGIALWRRAVMRPGEASDNLFDGLARALCRPEALPELVSGEATVESIGAMLRRNPAAIEFGLSAALDHASGLLRQEEAQALRQWEQECRQQGRTNDAERAVQLQEELKTAKKPARLVLVIDQLEELFTLEKLTPEERDGFILALAALARSGKAYVIATLRSDFFSRCAEAPLLVELSRQDGLYHLTPPTPEEIGQIIRQPAQAAGLRFEVIPHTGYDLAERLRDAAIRNPEALPLLEFCLEELYQGQAKRNDGWLRHADYEAMGGLEGALRQRAEAVYSALQPNEKEQFGHVMRAVTTVALDEAGIFNRRWADYEELARSPEAKGFVEAFLAPGARLFVANQTDDGRKIVSVAHEALLSAWNMLRDWLTANRENLQIRANLSAEAKRWRESGRNSDYLCPPGLPLEKGKQVQREGFLNREENEYVQSSVAKAEAVARRRVTVLRRWLAGVGLLAVLAIAGGCYGWWNAQKAVETLSQSDLWCGVELIKQNKDAQALASLARAVRGDPKNHAALVRLYTLLISQHSWPLPLTIPLRHDDEVLSACFSPDSTRVVTASQDKTAQVWDASTGQPIGDPMRHDGPVNSASFSPDGRQVVTASSDGTARLWDSSTGQPIGEPMHHDDEVYSASFSSDGTRIVTASADKTARLWDAHTGKPIGEPLHLESCVNSASFSPDGTRVITACGAKGDTEFYAQIWDARAGRPMGEPMRHEAAVVSASFSPDGTLVVTASSDGTARLWNARTGQPKGAPLRHDDEVLSAAFSPDGTRVVTASQDKTARLWDVRTSQPIGEPMRHDFEVNSARFSPDGTRVVTASWDKTTRLWDAHTGLPIGEPMLQEGSVNSASFSPDGTRIVTASDDYTARIWDAHTCQPLPLTLRHAAAVDSARFSPDGTRVVTASFDNTARLWDAHTGLPLGAPMRHDAPVISASFSPDGTRAVTASQDKTAHLWDASTGQPLGDPMRHEGVVISASFSPDGARVVTASQDKTARLWDAHTGQPLGQPLLQNNVVNSASFSPDGTRVVTACGDTNTDDYGKEVCAQLWDALTDQPMGTPMPHENPVCSASFSPDGTSVVTASMDFTARLWDGRTGQPLGKPMRHDDWVTSASFSPDGNRVVTGSNDNTARLWDAHTGQPDGRQMIHEGRVLSACFSPDSTRVLTASEDKTARLWDARTGQPISEPLRDEDVVNSAVFSPDGTCILTASADKTAQIWDILPPNNAVPPAWLPDLAEAVAGLTISNSSAYVPIDPAKYFKLKAQLANASGDDFWSKVSRWFFADRDARTISPQSAITIPEYQTHEAAPR